MILLYGLSSIVYCPLINGYSLCFGLVLIKRAVKDLLNEGCFADRALTDNKKFDFIYGFVSADCEK